MDKVGPTGMRVGRRLNELRRERGLTLADLEKRLENLGRPILLSALSKIEKDQRRVDVDDLVALAWALEVSPNSMLLPGPMDSDATVVLTPTTTLSLDDAWRWAIRDQPATRPRHRILIMSTPADQSWAFWIARLLADGGYDVTTDPWDLDRAACAVLVISESRRRADRGKEPFGPMLDRPDLALLRVIVDGSAVPEDSLAGFIRIDRSTEQQASDAITDAVERLDLPRRPRFDDARFPRPAAGRVRLRDYADSFDRPLHRAIVAIDVSGSTVRSNMDIAHRRQDLYQLFEAALRQIGVVADSGDLVDRGDGLIALIPPHDAVPKSLLLTTLIPALSELLVEHNSRRPVQPVRLRAVVHAGEVHFDRGGPFGESLNIALRLLDAPAVKATLAQTAAPLVLVVSDDMYRTVVRHGYEGIDDRAFTPLVPITAAGRSYRGWIHVPDWPVNPRGGGAAR